ncbi:hypothetical protein MBLNU457_4615t1 [Dothideomycetes sp. NU457]
MTGRRLSGGENGDTDSSAYKKAKTVEDDAMNGHGEGMTTDSATTSAAPDSQISAAAAIAYWSSTSADVDGMLGGFPQVTRADLQGSSNFLSKLRRSSKHLPPSKPLRRAADCGAGIGRITLGFLSKVAEVVDIVEPVEKFTERISAGDEFEEIRARGGIGQIWNTGLEAWNPPVANESDKYDLIWNQWCVGQLTDKDLTEYLRKSKAWLSEGGWVVVKENLSNDPADIDVYDEVDSSVTRTDKKFRKIFQDAGLKLVSTELQRGFPASLYPVRMYALRPEV